MVHYNIIVKILIICDFSGKLKFDSQALLKNYIFHYQTYAVGIKIQLNFIPKHHMYVMDENSRSVSFPAICNYVVNYNECIMREFVQGLFKYINNIK